MNTLMEVKMRSVKIFFIIASVGALLVGCAADRGAMVIEQKGVIQKSTTSFFVASAKNQQTVFSNVKDADLKAALEESLKKSGLYADSSKATFLVDVDLYKVDLPILGLAPTVTTKINYKLSSNEASKKVTNVDIVSSGKASFFDGITADLRVKVAVENAIKENFEKFINEIKK
jgi:hypothetical protein